MNGSEPALPVGDCKFVAGPGRAPLGADADRSDWQRRAPLSSGSRSTDAADSVPRPSFLRKADGGQIDVAAHLHHKVQVTGHLDTSRYAMPAVASTGTSGSTGTATPGRGPTALRLTKPTLHVTSLKMIAATCP